MALLRKKHGYHPALKYVLAGSLSLSAFWAFQAQSAPSSDDIEAESSTAPEQATPEQTAPSEEQAQQAPNNGAEAAPDSKAPSPPAETPGATDKPSEASEAETTEPKGKTEPKDEAQSVPKSPSDTQETPQDLAEPQDTPPSESEPKVVSVNGIECAGTGTCIVEASGLPMRVIPRSFAPMYKSPDSEEVLSSEVRGYQPAFVFAVKDLDLSDPDKPKGWYRVGYRPSLPMGWMKAQDVAEWRQALLAEFTPPGAGATRRPPALFFKDLPDLVDIATSPDRAELAEDLYQYIETSGSAPPIIGAESEDYVDITEKDNVYIYPILDWEEDPATNEKFLRVIATTPGKRRTAEQSAMDTRKNGSQDLSNADLEFVFVVDMTGSMGPYIDEIAKTLAETADQMSTSFSQAKSVRFGLVGYRDDIERNPGLEFRERNFTPDGLVSAQELGRILENGGKSLAADSTADEWAESIFPAVRMAINDMSWTPNSVRTIYLIGDASGHAVNAELDGKKAYPDGMQGPDELAQAASDKNIDIGTVYIRNDRAEVDWPLARAQFKNLARAENNDPYYVEFGQSSLDSFGATLQAHLTEFPYIFEMAESGGSQTSEAPQAQPMDIPPPDQVDRSDRERVQGFRAFAGPMVMGMVDYMGDDATAPYDFSGWITTQDLIDPRKQALDVRVLIKRRDLDNVIKAIEVIESAAAGANMTQMDFFTAIQEIAANASLDLTLTPSTQLGQSDLIPKWINSLPFKSEVLSLTPDDYENMSVMQREQLASSLVSKLDLLRTISADQDGWYKPDDNTPPLDEVYRLKLANLP